jgi:hypothetical protein
MNEERPEWWEVQIGNLMADPEALREVLEKQAGQINFWRDRWGRAALLAARLEEELAMADEKLRRLG